MYPQGAKSGQVGQGNFASRDLKRLEFHSDQGATDLIALLSLTKAKSGGVSKWVSAVAIHNELLRQGRKVLAPTSLPSSTCIPDAGKYAKSH